MSSHHIIEVSSNGNYISKYRGFLTIKNEEGQSHQIAFDKINSILVSGFNNTFNCKLIEELEKEHIALIFCDSSYQPHSILWNINPALLTKDIIAKQIIFNEKQNKKITHALLKNKILKQIEALKYFKIEPDPKLNKFLNESSKQPLAAEAQASRVYWKQLFGNDFYRSDQERIENSLLNYGYAIIRSCFCRYIVATGLHPSFAHFHTNKENFFALIDDVMELFRPIVDIKVKTVMKDRGDDEELTTHDKKELASILESIVLIKDKKTTVAESIKIFCNSYKNAIIDFNIDKIPYYEFISL